MSDVEEFIKAAQEVVTTPAKSIEPEETKSDSVSQEQPKQEVTEQKEDFKFNFDRIARQDKLNRDARKALEEQRKAADKDKEELEKYRMFDKQLKDDPLGILEKLGLSYERIQQLAIQRNQPLDPKALEAKLKAQVQQEFESRDKLLKEEKFKIEEMKLQTRIIDTIKQNEFDLIETFKAEGAVKEFMETYFDETGEVPDIKMACEAITTDLVERINKVQNSKWLSASEKKEAIKQIKDPELDKKPGIKTLSNKLTQSSQQKSSRPMTEDERILAAMALL